MQILTQSLFANYLPLTIYIAGFIVCLTGYRRLKRKIYLYATLFFAVNILQNSWILPFSRYYTYPFNETLLTISSYVNFSFMLLSLATLGLLVWGFYREALLSYQEANNV
ncbi:MAG: hypothetical protein SCJ94_10125 [Bacillota bacterium]|nr:hypothetical protein [Bacillota bacterium]MDW7730344.1 hypothetical protein [Bacillota bacterium]